VVVVRGVGSQYRGRLRSNDNAIVSQLHGFRKKKRGDIAVAAL
jgi:hypothetical protein